MSHLMQLWLPILAAAVFVFVASSLIHMVFKWHNSDYSKLSNEDEVMATLRAGSPRPGQYVLPHCADMKQMQDESMKQKYRAGPVGFLTLVPAREPNIAPSLIRWFIFNIVVAAIAGGIALQTYGLQANPHYAGHLAGLTSFLTYAGGSVQSGIWMGKPWKSVAKDLLDALIYGTVSAFTFMLLWPAAG
jgi:hypothetical protein